MKQWIFTIKFHIDFAASGLAGEIESMKKKISPREMHSMIQNGYAKIVDCRVIPNSQVDLDGECLAKD